MGRGERHHREHVRPAPTLRHPVHRIVTWHRLRLLRLEVVRYDRGQRSSTKSNSRRFGTGRLVVEHASADGNAWLRDSELAVYGRAVAGNEGEDGVGAPTVRLPKGQELLLPESGSPDGDIRLSERIKPSPEQSAAQKGVARWEVLISSLVKNMTLRGPLLLCNYTGYVEEVGTAAP